MTVPSTPSATVLYAAGIPGPIRHLFVAEEMLAMRLCVMHNLYFYNKLMEKIRNALDEGRFSDFRREYSSKLAERL